jgi:RimJ/RimL family protein N-acetyltransferase
VHFPGIKRELLAAALESFYEMRNLPGLKKKPSTSELIDWLKLLMAEDIPPRRCAAGPQGRDPAAARRAAQERAGRAPVRAAGVHEPRQPLRKPMTRFVQPVTLTGSHATLAPLSMDHAEACAKPRPMANCTALVHRCPRPKAWKPRSSAAWTCTQDSMQPFTVLDADGRAAGMTTYMNIDGKNRRVEIGSTWYARRVQRTALNTECKLMLLRHAFETLDCIAVEFRTHWMNHQSRAAIARLGAKQDGVLRNHQRMPDGSFATRWCSRSSPANGPPCARTCNSSSTAR